MAHAVHHPSTMLHLRSLSVFALGALALLVACGDAGTAGTLHRTSGSSANDTDPTEATADDPSAGPAGGGTGSTSGGASSGGGPTSTDAGAADAQSGPDAAGKPNPNDPFAGAAAFVQKVAGSTHHPGQDCMGGCHNHGFTFAGTLVDGAGNGVADAEVRLVDATGKAILVNTGSNGNFHSSTPFTAPARIGARTATSNAAMVGTLKAADGGCNGCHKSGGTAPPVHVP